MINAKMEKVNLITAELVVGLTGEEESRHRLREQRRTDRWERVREKIEWLKAGLNG
jgi:hypothetical protein